MDSGPQSLPAILRALHPWLRARLTSIHIVPLIGGGWSAQLSYLAYTEPPPPPIPGVREFLFDTHHPLALPAVKNLL